VFSTFVIEIESSFLTDLNTALYYMVSFLLLFPFPDSFLAYFGFDSSTVYMYSTFEVPSG